MRYRILVDNTIFCIGRLCRICDYGRSVFTVGGGGNFVSSIAPIGFATCNTDVETF
jgi:hypothetical protein